MWLGIDNSSGKAASWPPCACRIDIELVNVSAAEGSSNHDSSSSTAISLSSKRSTPVVSFLDRLRAPNYIYSPKRVHERSIRISHTVEPPTVGRDELVGPCYSELIVLRVIGENNVRKLGNRLEKKPRISHDRLCQL